MKKHKMRDDSPYVYQRDKIGDTLTLKELKWTEKQKEFISLACHSNTKIIFVSGPAGTSKTLLSIYCALKLVSEKKLSELIYIRSAVESSDARLGYLPGDVEEKLQYYNMPLMDKLDELLPRSEVNYLINDKRVKVHPTNFSRGMSWNANCIILDEAQNSSQKEIITILTRLGPYSKCFILADPYQTDLHNGKRGGFETIAKVFSDEDSKRFGIHTFTFTKDDIVRSELVKFIVSKLENLPQTI